MVNNAIVEVVNRIEDILKNPKDEPADTLGSYIVGATLVRDDIEQYFEKYPLLENIAELGADLETQAGTEYAKDILAEIENKFRVLKEQVREEEVSIIQRR